MGPVQEPESVGSANCAGQRWKHDYVAETTRVRTRSRVLDLGCGWRPLLNHIRTIGAEGIGVTLSTAQAAACRRNGLRAEIRDGRTIGPDTFGAFDAVGSPGAFEHFCSVEEYRAGKQDETYSDLFRRVASLLPPGGRFFLQTMVFGKNMIPADQVDVNAPRESDAFYRGLLSKQFPGSWLPYDAEQIERTAEPHFRLVSASSGRLDYVETIRQWRVRFGVPRVRKTLLKLRLAPPYPATWTFASSRRRWPAVSMSWTTTSRAIRATKAYPRGSDSSHRDHSSSSTARSASGIGNSATAAIRSRGARSPSTAAAASAAWAGWLSRWKLTRNAATNWPGRSPGMV